MGPRNRPGGPQRDRLAGHPHPGASATNSAAAAARTGYRDGSGCRWRRTSRPEGALDPRPRRRRARPRGERRAVFGTIDSWVLWNLTGGAEAASTSPTSRTRRARCSWICARSQWDSEIAGRSASRSRCCRGSSFLAGVRQGRRGPFAGMPIAGILGDQQAATFGQACLSRARPRTPTAPAISCCSTPARSRCSATTGCSPRCVTGSATRTRCTRSRARSRSPGRWCSGCATTSESSRPPAKSRSSRGSVDDNGGAYFVPAFSGLFAPHWRPDARGAIVGLTRYVNEGAPGASGVGGHRISDA